jgi:hypothetical protein
MLTPTCRSTLPGFLKENGRAAAHLGSRHGKVPFWHNADHSEAAYGPARLEDHNAFVVRRHCADKAMNTLFRDLPPVRANRGVGEEVVAKL